MLTARQFQLIGVMFLAAIEPGRLPEKHKKVNLQLF